MKQAHLTHAWLAAGDDAKAQDRLIAICAGISGDTLPP
jgi:hypothetical protein